MEDNTLNNTGENTDGNMSLERRTVYEEVKDQVLTCPICLDKFSDPRVFPCQHSFCYECIKVVITSKNSSESSIKCPVCNTVHPIPTNANFPRNLDLGRLIDFLDTSIDNPRHSVSSNTGTTPITPMSSLTLATTAPVVRCESHNTEMKCFCVDCKQLLCELCPMTEHKTHTTDKIDRLKKSYVDELRGIVTECEKRIIVLDTEVDDLIRKDTEAVSSCRKNIKKYYDEHEGMLENEIAKLNAKLDQVKCHRERLVDKFDGFSHNLEKRREIDKGNFEHLKGNISRAITSARALIDSSDASMMVHKYNQVKEELKEASCARVDHSSLNPVPVISLGKGKDPTVCEFIDCRSVLVQGMDRIVKPGPNNFTLTLTTPLINQPRFKVDITLPNGRRDDSVKFESLGENSWSVSYFVPNTIFFSSSKVTISVKLCGIEIDGSPFILPCTKTSLKNLVLNA